MTYEILITQIEQMERKQIPQGERPAFVTVLRTRPDRLEGRSETEWKRGNIYFHALQDLLFSEIPDVQKEEIQAAQGCFVRDIDQYLAGLPLHEERMRNLIEAILETGTSFVWEEDLSSVSRLHNLFKMADQETIRPWVNEVSS